MPPRAKLSKQQITDVAMRMLDTGGAAGFSMRKLAQALEVDPMAVYHHHASKSALIFAVLDAMMRQCEVPPPSGDWQRDIRALCQGLRRLAHRHPGCFRIYETYEDWLPAEHRLHEALHATLLGADFAPREAVRAARLLLAYTETFAVDEVSGWLDPEDVEHLRGSLACGPYPTLMHLLEEIGHTDPDAEFAFGLDVILRGLEGTHGVIETPASPRR